MVQYDLPTPPTSRNRNHNLQNAVNSLSLKKAQQNLHDTPHSFVFDLTTYVAKYQRPTLMQIIHFQDLGLTIYKMESYKTVCIEVFFTNLT